MIAAERTWPDAEEFEEVLKNLLFKIFIFDCDTLKFLWASEECLRHLGYTRGELIRMTPLKVYPDLKIEGFSRILLPLVTHQKDKVHIETVYRRHDGAVFPVELQISLTEIAGRHAFVGIVFDISDRKDARHDAARLGEMLRAVLKLPVAFFRLDEHGHVTESLGEGLEHVGFKGEDVLGANVFEKWPEYADAFRRVLAGGSTHFELRHAADNGEILLQNYLTFDKVHERGAIGIAVDISERKRIEADLRRLASTDPLTGAFNRRHFLETLDKEIVRARRYGRVAALLLLAVDGLDGIVAQHGQAVGDAVLQRVAATCRATLRDHDIIGRLGGDTFAVLLPETPGKGSRVVAERLRQLLGEAPVPAADGAPLHIDVAIAGVAYDGTASSAADVVSQAERILTAVRSATPSTPGERIVMA